MRINGDDERRQGQQPHQNPVCFVHGRIPFFRSAQYITNRAVAGTDIWCVVLFAFFISSVLVDRPDSHAIECRANRESAKRKRGSQTAKKEKQNGSLQKGG
jgi:hypothetical protein